MSAIPGLETQRTCPIHGTWIFPLSAHPAVVAFEREHAGCKRPPPPGRSTPHRKIRRWP